ncbi:MAG: CBS domain-containing protein [Dehalococcoidia bacterium]|nr:CBS domain-containing protein [Dehalococcoidia bacterium]
MRVRDLMSTNLVTVSSKTPITEARRYMVAHRIHRLPVVDKDRLVGIVTERRIAEASPTEATSLSIWEMNYLIARMTVGEIMNKNVTTITSDTTVESAIALAQELKVGALCVVDNGKLVGIVTNNDIYYRILNPILGIGKPGVRLQIHDCGEGRKIEDVLRLVNKSNLKIEAIHMSEPADRDAADLIVQVDVTDPGKLIDSITGLGYKVEIRQRKFENNLSGGK